MRRTSSLAPFTALALLLSTGIASAERPVEWHDLRGQPAARALAGQPAGSARASAEATLQAASAELRLAGVDLRFDKDLASGAHRTVRFTQQHGGLPVIGAAAAVRIGPDGAARAAVLDVARGITVSTTPEISEDAARAEVEGRVGQSLQTPPSIRLAVDPGQEGGRLVWMVDVMPGTRRAARYLVDAHQGGVVGFRPLALDALGRVYAISSANTPTPTDVTLTDLDVATPQMLNGWSGNLTVTNYVSGTSMSSYTVEQTLTPNSGEDFLYDPPADGLDATDAFAQVGIFYHLTRIRNYFSGVHAVDMAPASWRVTAVANLLEDGQPMDNAFFAPDAQGAIAAPFDAPNMIGIGQGSQFDFADDSDVFLHEFGHYVSHNAVGYNLGQLGMNEYGISPWSGAIDEGIADYFACTLNGDSTLGEASLAPLGAARELTDVAKVCPDDVIGEVHADGEIIGSISWSIRTALGQERGDRLVWGAITLLTPGASLGDFGRALRTTADGMEAQGDLTAAEVQTVQDLIASRGLDDCDHELEVSPTKPRQTNMLGLDVLSGAFGGSCDQLRNFGVKLHSWFHFRAKPAADDKGIRFSVDLTPITGGNDLRWSIYGRAGQHVVMGAGATDFLPTPKEFDFKVEGLSAESGEMVIDASSAVPFDPTQTYYFVIVDESCPATRAEVSVSAANESSGEGGAGGGGTGGAGGGGAGGDEPKSDSDADADSGCGCRVAGEATGSAPWAALGGLALGAAALLRRRRNRG